MTGEAWVQVVNLILLGLLAGVDLGSVLLVQPALVRLPESMRAEAVRAVFRRTRRLLPALVVVGLATALVATGIVAVTRPLSVWLPLIGLLALAGMVAASVKGSLPALRGLLALPDGTDEKAWKVLWHRWDRWQTLRVGLEIGALAAFAIAAVWD